MGRVYRDNRSRSLYIDYVDHRGKRVRRRAVGCRTKAQANIMLADAEADERQIRRDIERGLYDGRTNHVDVASLLEEYFLHQLATKRYGSVIANRTALADTVGYFKRRPDVRGGYLWPPRLETPLDEVMKMRRRFVHGPLEAGFVDEITPGKLEAWTASHRRGRRYAMRTINLRIKTVKAFLNWAEQDGRIRSNPVAGVRLPGRAAQRRWRALTREEVESLLAASPEPYQTLWLAFASTGMRHGELVKLTWPAVDLAKRVIRVRQETSKAARERVIPMTLVLRDRLIGLRGKTPDPDGYVFLNRDGRPWRNNLETRFQRCAERAGLRSRIVWEGRHWHLEYRNDENRLVREKLPASSRREAEAIRRERRGQYDRQVVIHSLRHTVATELLRQRVGVEVVRDLLGHSTIVTTLQTYAHVLQTDREDAVARLDFGSSLAADSTSVLQAVIPRS